jgi:hypothetical protein
MTMLEIAKSLTTQTRKVQVQFFKHDEAWSY